MPKLNMEGLHLTASLMDEVGTIPDLLPIMTFVAHHTPSRAFCTEEYRREREEVKRMITNAGPNIPTTDVVNDLQTVVPFIAAFRLYLVSFSRFVDHVLILLTSLKLGQKSDIFPFAVDTLASFLKCHRVRNVFFFQGGAQLMVRAVYSR